MFSTEKAWGVRRKESGLDSGGTQKMALLGLYHPRASHPPSTPTFFWDYEWVRNAFVL